MPKTQLGLDEVTYRIIYLYLGALIGVTSGDVLVSQAPEEVTTLPAALRLEPHCRRAVMEVAKSIPIIHGKCINSFKGCPTVVHNVYLLACSLA